MHHISAGLAYITCICRYVKHMNPILNFEYLPYISVMLNMIVACPRDFLPGSEDGGGSQSSSRQHHHPPVDLDKTDLYLGAALSVATGSAGPTAAAAAVEVREMDPWKVTNMCGSGCVKLHVCMFLNRVCCVWEGN